MCEAIYLYFYGTKILGKIWKIIDNLSKNYPPNKRQKRARVHKEIRLQASFQRKHIV